jgi:hypothetical protein
MNVIENSTLIELCGGFPEKPSPSPTPATDPIPADPCPLFMYPFDIDHPPYKDPDIRLLITN